MSARHPRGGVNMTRPSEALRIIHLMTHLRFGAGRVIADLAIEQRRRGNEVLVALADDAEDLWRSDPFLRKELASAGVDSVCIGDYFHRRRRGLEAAVRNLQRIIAGSGQTTVAHAHTAMAVAVARWAGIVRVVATCHGWNPNRPDEYDLQDALAWSMADALVSPSTFWASRLSQLPGTAQVAIVPCGFNLDAYPQLPRRNGAERLRIVCVGELTPRKGQDVLLEAMPWIWRDEPSAEVHLIGTGDAESDLRTLARRLDADSARIYFHGHVDKPYSLLQDYTLFCLPSRSDNQPVAIVEAMLAGLPVVATEVGGIPEMILEGECGEVVAPNSPRALAGAVSRVFARRDRSDLATCARTFARARYDVVAEADQLWELYYGDTPLTGRCGAHGERHADRPSEWSRTRDSDLPE